MPRKPDHISQEAWDAVDSPELTEDEFVRMKPAREALKPALFEKLTKRRGPQKAPTKEAVSLRLDRDVVEHFRAQGRGWQTKINRVLRESMKADGRKVVKDHKQTSRLAATGTFATQASAVKAAKSAAASVRATPKSQSQTGRGGTRSAGRAKKQ